MQETLADFGIDVEKGFIPTKDPLLKLGSKFDAWENICNQLPKLLVADSLRREVQKMPLISSNALKTEAEIERAMLLLSYIGHGYVWAEKDAAQKLPKNLAVPWWEVSQKLKRPPVLSYPSYALWNWRRIDSKGPIALGNIALLQNFLAGVDEEWFILVHVDIEAKAAGVLSRTLNLHPAAIQGNEKELADNLKGMANSLQQMYAALDRMPERCDPYIYYNRVRPYIHGWKNNPALPNGLIYEGVDAYNGEGQKFRGETGAQSSIIPSLDAVLGVVHKNDFMKAYLLEMRDYMPEKHRQFIEALEKRPSLRDLISQKYKTNQDIVSGYNACIEWIDKFRTLHLSYAVSYIEKQHEVGTHNPTKIGTGGTPFVPYLTKHRDETGDHRIKP